MKTPPPPSTEVDEIESSAIGSLAVTDSAFVLRELDRADSARRLIDFMRILWPVVEPSRPFVTGWALGAICEHLEAVTMGQITYLAVTVPPGFAKSLSVGVFWPAWEWGPRNLPSMRHLSASYSASLVIRDNMRCRRLVESAEYRAMWGDRFALTGDQNAKTKFENDKTGWKQIAVVGGATGERADRATLDDVHSVKGAESTAVRESTLSWFSEAWSSRVNDVQTSARIIMGQRTHERDVTGLALATNPKIVHLCIPMNWRDGHPYIAYNFRPTAIGWTDPRTTEGELAFPERFSAAGVEQLKSEMRAWGGTYAESAQLDQVPTPRGGGMFRKDKFKTCALVDVPAGGKVVRGWDLAASTGTTSAYTACVKMRRVGGQLYIEDVRRVRATAREVEKLIVQCAQDDGDECVQDIPQDPGQAGKAQKSYLAEALAGHRFQFSPESGDKAERAAPLAAQVEADNVSLVKAPWNDAFAIEASSFPVGAFKDQIDAASRAFSALLRRPDVAAIPSGPLMINIAPENR